MSKELFLKGEQEYRLLRNVSDPILFLGVPLKISIISLISIVFSIIIGFVLHSIGAPGIVAGIVSISLLCACTLGVRSFYKKYGVNGYELSRRDKILTDEIVADVSISVLLKN